MHEYVASLMEAVVAANSNATAHSSIKQSSTKKMHCGTAVYGSTKPGMKSKRQKFVWLVQRESRLV